MCVWKMGLTIGVGVLLAGIANAAADLELTPLIETPVSAAPPAGALGPAPVGLVIPADQPIAFQRPNRWDVWNNYAVDCYGYFRPRVIQTPTHAYYLFNGAPYPSTPVRQINVITYLFD